ACPLPFPSSQFLIVVPTVALPECNVVILQSLAKRTSRRGDILHQWCRNVVRNHSIFIELTVSEEVWHQQADLHPVGNDCYLVFFLFRRKMIPYTIVYQLHSLFSHGEIGEC